MLDRPAATVSGKPEFEKHWGAELTFAAMWSAWEYVALVPFSLVTR